MTEETLRQSQIACVVRNTNLASGGVTSSAPAPAELSDTQFNASLDALMSGENWLGMSYGQIAPNSIGETAGLPIPKHGAMPSQIETSMTPSYGLLGKQGHTSNNSTIINASAVTDIGTYESLFPGKSVPQFGGFNFGTSTPLIPPSTSSFPPMVTFAPIQPSSSSDFEFKPPASKRRRPGGSVNSASISAVSEDEGDRGKRRNDRNHREQQRSQQIAHQISYLRDMLSTANVHFKPDKYSTLVTVADFIKSLQEKVELLDSEHKKLLNTIVQTTNAVNSQLLPQGGSGSTSESMKVTDFFDDGKVSPLHDDDCPPFVSGLDYKAVFECCPVASAITSIDGRFLDCNRDFEELSGFAKSELVSSPKNELASGGGSAATSKKPARSMSLFNTVRREHMEGVFMAMSEMLKIPFTDFQAAESSADGGKDVDAWSGVVTLVRKEGVKVRAYFTLTVDDSLAS
jgi:PAS domain-containing protein